MYFHFIIYTLRSTIWFDGCPMVPPSTNQAFIHAEVVDPQMVYSSFHSLVFRLAQAYGIRWWMGHYGASSAKPQRGICNNKMFGHVNKGKFNYKEFQRGQPQKVQTVKKTISKTSGKTSWSGTSKLKDTQCQSHLFLIFSWYTWFHAWITNSFQDLLFFIFGVPAEDLPSSFRWQDQIPFPFPGDWRWGYPWDWQCCRPLPCFRDAPLGNLGWSQASLQSQIPEGKQGVANSRALAQHFPKTFWNSSSLGRTEGSQQTLGCLRCWPIKALCLNTLGTHGIQYWFMFLPRLALIIVDETNIKLRKMGKIHQNPKKSIISGFKHGRKKPF